MKNTILMFSSVTLAMKSRNILLRYKINSKIIRTPMHLSNRSCGYSLLIFGDVEKSAEILRKNGIPVLGVATIDTI